MYTRWPTGEPRRSNLHLPIEFQVDLVRESLRAVCGGSVLGRKAVVRFPDQLRSMWSMFGSSHSFT